MQKNKITNKITKQEVLEEIDKEKSILDMSKEEIEKEIIIKMKEVISLNKEKKTIDNLLIELRSRIELLGRKLGLSKLNKKLKFKDTENDRDLALSLASKDVTIGYDFEKLVSILGDKANKYIRTVTSKTIDEKLLKFDIERGEISKECLESIVKESGTEYIIIKES